ncbi:hypothetical protein HT031_005099 [Scenedesmus sp. PABB004]|nr:hypothetical protein HT031_005099 [Scenedesmus sp. PABB004]
MVAAAPTATPTAPATIGANATAAAAKPAAAAPAATAKSAAAPAGEQDAETAAADAEAQAAAAKIDIDLSSIPKIETEDVVLAGGSTSVGQNTTTGAKKGAVKVIPLEGFEPVWPADKPNNKDQVLIDVVTDSPIADIKANAIPFIQSLAEALSVDTSQVYWKNLTQSDLNIATFLIDTDSPEAKQRVLASLATPENTVKFYENASAYTLNILNGPEVSPDELNLSTDVISTPDKASAYDGDTGLISNNATAASAAAAPRRGHGLAPVLLAFGAVAAAALV